MARHMPIPDIPLREIIQQMYVSPEAWEHLCAERAKELNLDEWQALEVKLHPSALRLPEHVEKEWKKPRGVEGIEGPTPQVF